MKISSDRSEFSPITIILEKRYEASVVLSAIDSFIDKYSKSIKQIHSKETVFQQERIYPGDTICLKTSAGDCMVLDHEMCVLKELQKGLRKSISRHA